MTAHAEDVAAAILDRLGPLDTIKLQKLVYYAQAWHLTWREEPLFEEPVEAWDNGPVVRSLFNMHRGAYKVSRLGRGDATNIAGEAEHVVEFVCRFYGDKTGAELVLHVHEEDPWDYTYHELGRNEVIESDRMVKYYGSLAEPNDQAWVWLSGAYQDVEAAEQQVARGEGVRHLSDDDFLSSL